MKRNLKSARRRRDREEKEGVRERGGICTEREKERERDFGISL